MDRSGLDDFRVSRLTELNAGKASLFGAFFMLDSFVLIGADDEVRVYDALAEYLEIVAAAGLPMSRFWDVVEEVLHGRVEVGNGDGLVLHIKTVAGELRQRLLVAKCG